MLTTFIGLRGQYASREITMEDLGVLNGYDCIRFENRGVSRSNLECLLCEVYCEPLEAFLKSAVEKVYDSAAAFRDAVIATGLGLIETVSDDGACIAFASADESMEMVAVVDEAGRVRVDPEDIDAVPYFQVFLRIQGG